MKTEKIVIETYKNLMTGKERKVKYVRQSNELAKKFGVSVLYKSEGHYYVHGIIGWFNVDMYNPNKK